MSNEASDPASEPGQSSDLVIRALTDEGSFRVLTARTTETCREAVARQSASGLTARHFGDLLTGTVLVRETMAPTLRVQGIVRGAGGGCTLIGDSFPDGGTRGLVTCKKGETELVLGGDAILQFMRSLPNGSVHRGVVQVPPEGGMSGALMAYMQESEQIVTMMAMATLFDDAGQVRSAGGYVVQLLPGSHPELVAVMTERLAHDFSDITSFVDAPRFDPDALLEEIMYAVPFSRTETRPVFFHCPCSQASVLASLATLDVGDIEGFIQEGEVLDIGCDYCGKQYQVAPDQLRGLLSQS
ncbi:MAG TPA: Hsp33 family molecular chaperone HslO [Polyangiales bacterium]|nr:Hsp33 family molecular chaperone HslO [Polyangiales bacterium]